MILGGTPYNPEALIAILLRSIDAQVTTQLGSPPANIVVTHPASYGPYKLDLLKQAVRQAELANVSYVSEPVAAAVQYASLEQVPKGATIAVYDFGGGTFDATILESTEAGFQALGTPEGLERLGGIDFDEAIFRHVAAAIGAPVTAADPADPAVLVGLARLREECRRAKEALSADTDATIPVFLPNLQTEVRITRGEFEQMIEPRIAETIAALDRAARSADVRMVELDRILLIGGTSRIPRIGEMVHAATRRPVAVDAHPKHGVALGAARIGLEGLGLGTRSVPASAATKVPPAVSVASAPPASASGGPPGTTTAGRVAQARPSARPRQEADRSSRPSWLIPAGIALAGVILAGGALLASGLLSGGPASSAAPAASTLIVPTLPPAPTPFVPAGASARLTGVVDAGDHYEAAFTVSGFTPSMSGQHVHFFWNSVPPDQAGEPGDGPYVVYAGPSPFTGFSRQTRPGGATGICIIVANTDHSVVAGSGSCIALP
jgi:actin-like ATPase involved in cell morphogenesis